MPPKMRAPPEGRGKKRLVQVECRIPETTSANSSVAQRRAPGPIFGVVIPTLNEADTIEQAVQHVRGDPSVTDVVVVDGGSDDLTWERARRAGARVERAARGRGAQMNAGARIVGGDVLVFLHADCRLPGNAFEAMAEVLVSGCDAGLFAIDYHASHPLLQLASRLSKLRFRWTEFGEGALFVRRRRFERVGGFPEWPLFEDVELLGHLRRAGTLGRARGRVQVSPRRFQRRGVGRQLLLNALLYCLFHVGVSPHRLHGIYDATARPPTHES